MPRTPAGETRSRVLRFVTERLLSGEPPTVREVQGEFGFRAVETAREHLEGLVAEGRLAKLPGRARGYRLPAGAGAAAGGARVGETATLVPLVGEVAAGALAEAIEDPEGYVATETRPGGGEELFALRVRGESMTGAGILPGDVVIVRRQPRAEPGDIVVALVGDEATVKRLRLSGVGAVLEPENPAFRPIRVRRDELRLLGKVVEVRRSLECA